MLNFKNLFFALLLSTAFTGFIFAQPPPAVSSKSSSSNTQNKENFVSLDGGFTIALPKYPSGFSGVNPVAGVSKGGSQFSWKTPQGYFTIGYSDRIFQPNTYKQVLQDSADGLISHITNDGGKLINKNEISMGGNSGVEVRMLLKEGVIAVGRYILVKDRMYTLTTGWKDGEDGKQQLKTLDTFNLIDRKTAIAQKLEEATPKPLPQEPAASKLKSDAEDEGLKGKVKLVIEEKEDLTGTWSVSGINKTVEEYYNEKSNRIKRIFYDYKGNPMTVTVYGYIDGKRVTNSGYLTYEYNPPPVAVSPSSAEKPKPSETRFSVGYEYNYDDRGRLKETIAYRNDGEMTNKTVYSYDRNKLEESSFNKAGELTFKTIKVFDDKSNLIEKTFVRPNSSSNSNYTYKYESFDEKGNWTKRIVSGLESSGKKQNYIEYRTITYW